MKLLKVGAMFVSLFIAGTVVKAQSAIPAKNNVEVTGHAEVEVDADEFYFSISLKEFYEDEKNQKNKVEISTLEKQILQAVSKAGLNKEDLKVAAIGGVQYNWEKKKIPATFLETKQYELKVNSVEKLDGILAFVNSRGINHAYISKVEYSGKEALEKSLKVQALKAAKDKANYMVEALDEKLGSAIFVQDLNEYNSVQPVYMRMAKASPAAMEASDEMYSSPVNYKKIKMSARVKVIFEIAP